MNAEGDITYITYPIAYLSEEIVLIKWLPIISYTERWLRPIQTQGVDQWLKRCDIRTSYPIVMSHSYHGNGIHEYVNYPHSHAQVHAHVRTFSKSELM